MKPKSLKRFSASVIKNSPGADCIMYKIKSAVKIKIIRAASILMKFKSRPARLRA